MGPDGFYLSTADTPSWEASCTVSPQGLDPRPGAVPSCCPFCGNQVRTYSAAEEQRRQLNALLSQAYLHATVPSPPVPVKKPKMIKIPWARPGTGFTQMFEALVMALIRQMPVKVAATILETRDARLWRLIDGDDGRAASSGQAASFPLAQRSFAGDGAGCLSVCYDLELSFDTSTGESLTVRSSAETPPDSKEKTPNFAAVASELPKALVCAALAALIVLAWASLASTQFRGIKRLNDAFGLMSAEEGSLYPGLSRAPPRSV